MKKIIPILHEQKRLLSHFPVVFIFLGSFIVSFVLYFNTADGRFVYDFNSWSLIYLKQGAAGIIHCFGDHSPHFFYHLVNYLLLRAFWLNKWTWLITALTLHSLNATLLFAFVRKILKDAFGFSSVEPTAWASLLFVVFPYQAEAIVWGASLHYLYTTALILTCLVLFLLYSQKKSTRYVTLLHLTFIVALFSLEISIALPLLFAALIFLLPQFSKNVSSIREPFVKIILPQLAIITAYFVINKLRGNDWVGHYGTAAHLNFNPEVIIPNYSKFFLKFLIFGEFFPYNYRNWMCILLEKKIFVFAGTLFYLLIFTFPFLMRKADERIKIPFIFLVLFMLSLLPVINLYFVHLPENEQDRYGYFPSTFFLTFLAITLFACLRMRARLILAVYVCLSIFFLFRNTYKWNQTGAVSNSLVSDFRWPDADKIYILSIADNFGGAYLFRSQPQSSFAEAIELRQGIDLSQKINEVAQFNMEHAADKVNVAIENDSTLKVSFSQEGNWWWRGGYGAVDYETENYKVDFDEGGQYILTMKNQQPGDIYIYQAGGEWAELKGF